MEVAEIESRLASGRARCRSMMRALRSSEMGIESRLSRLLGVERPESREGGASEALSREGGSIEMVLPKERPKLSESLRCCDEARLSGSAEGEPMRGGMLGNEGEACPWPSPKARAGDLMGVEVEESSLGF